MRTRQSLSLMIALLCTFSLMAQSTTVYTEADESFKRGEAFMTQGLFEQAQTEFQKTIHQLRPVNEPRAELLLTRAEFNYAKAAVQSGSPDGEKLILQFIRKYQPDPIANDALVEIANYYYNAGKYEQAVTYYSQIPTTGMTREQKSEVRFRMGYSLFVQKEFDKAKANFMQIKDFDNEYYYPTNYYLGLCYFFEGKHNEAINQFRIVEKSRKYRDYIPYYLAQIYFSERRFNELIAYAEPRLSDSRLKNNTEIQQLIGLSYFETGNYAKALPYLQNYAESSGKLKEEEWYQLGYVQYQAGDYANAARSFSELATVDSKMGQSANYYLAVCHLHMGDRASAFAAFGHVKRMDYDPELKEEAEWNYAKLAYELNLPGEAISSLQAFPPTSSHYNEAQSLISQAALTYRDYQQALDILEKMPNKTPQIQEGYQKIAYLRGLQLMRENRLDEAQTYFVRSQQNPIDPQTRALTLYWMADIAHRKGDYSTSIQTMNQYLTMAKTMSNLPDEASVFTGSYIQGYNYLKQENYTSALGYFEETVNGIRRNQSFIGNQAVKNQLLGDATVRTGDAYFKRNEYGRALRYYDEAIERRYSGFIYAIYQKAMIEGLQGRNTEKILALERIPQEFPNSEYADDALLQLGITYQETGRLSNAVVPLQKLVTDYRNSSPLINQALLQLGLISYNQGNLEMAINYYKQIFSNNPEPEESNPALAALEEIYIDDMGRADDYFAFLETVPGYKVDNMAKDSVNFQAAESQFENANYNRAIQAYTDYLLKFPNGRYTLQAAYHRGESYSVLRQYTEALRDYEYVATRGPSRYYEKALEKAAIIAYNHEQNFEKSFQLYQQLETAAQDPDTRFEAQLGALRSAYRVNNTQEVYRLAGKVANNPSANQQQKATANFYLGKIAFDRRDYDGALNSFNMVVQNSDNEQTAEARYLTAYIYYMKRDLNRARELTLNANKESSAYPHWVAKSVILLSDILAEQGDLYNARAALEALLENYNEDPELVNIARTKLDQINQQLNNSSRLQRSVNPNRLEMQEEGGRK